MLARVSGHLAAEMECIGNYIPVGLSVYAEPGEIMVRWAHITEAAAPVWQECLHASGKRESRHEIASRTLYVFGPKVHADLLQKAIELTKSLFDQASWFGLVNSLPEQAGYVKQGVQGQRQLKDVLRQVSFERIFKTMSAEILSAETVKVAIQSIDCETQADEHHSFVITARVGQWVQVYEGSPLNEHCHDRISDIFANLNL